MEMSRWAHKKNQTSRNRGSNLKNQANIYTAFAKKDLTGLSPQNELEIDLFPVHF